MPAPAPAHLGPSQPLSRGQAGAERSPQAGPAPALLTANFPFGKMPETVGGLILELEANTMARAKNSRLPGSRQRRPHDARRNLPSDFARRARGAARGCADRDVRRHRGHRQRRRGQRLRARGDAGRRALHDARQRRLPARGARARPPRAWRGDHRLRGRSAAAGLGRRRRSRRALQVHPGPRRGAVPRAAGGPGAPRPARRRACWSCSGAPRRPFTPEEVVLATALAAVLNHALERGEGRERQRAADADRRTVRLSGVAIVGGAAMGRAEALPTLAALARSGAAKPGAAGAPASAIWRRSGTGCAASWQRAAGALTGARAPRSPRWR